MLELNSTLRLSSLREPLHQHNLNVWTFDKAIIGTNVGEWKMPPNGDGVDVDIKAFIEADSEEENTSQNRHIKLGDFSRFTEFLKRTIGAHEELRYDQ